MRIDEIKTYFKEEYMMKANTSFGDFLFQKRKFLQI